jgi:hypothetical protein
MVAPNRLGYVKPYEVCNFWALAFPHLYPFGTGGPDSTNKNEVRQRPHHITDSAYDKHMLMESSQRFCSSMAWVFARYKYRMSQTASGIAFAATGKSKNGQAPLTVGKLKEVAEYSKMGINRDVTLPVNVELDSILKFLKGFGTKLRTSHIYIAMERARLLARLASPLMPNPTWFMTLSSADLCWPELWMALRPDLTVHTAGKLSFAQRASLLNANPVMACRMFRCRIEALLQEIVLNGDYHPVGSVLDWWFRVEFQNRGSLHVHSILWSMLQSASGVWMNGDEMGELMTKAASEKKESELDIPGSLRFLIVMRL